MEHLQLAYLGIRQIPRELTEFELATFSTYSVKERALIHARRTHLYRGRIWLATHVERAACARRMSLTRKNGHISF
jgi:hypothetical protein